MKCPARVARRTLSSSANSAAATALSVYNIAHFFAVSYAKVDVLSMNLGSPEADSEALVDFAQFECRGMELEEFQPRVRCTFFSCFLCLTPHCRMAFRFRRRKERLPLRTLILATSSGSTMTRSTTARWASTASAGRFARHNGMPREARTRVHHRRHTCSFLYTIGKVFQIIRS